MGVVLREGRVSLVEKKGGYYLRASLPCRDGVGVISRWLSTGERVGVEGLKVCLVKARELDSDLARWRLGLEFPFQKWDNRREHQSREDELSQYRDRLELTVEKVKPVAGDTGNGLNEVGNGAKEFTEAKVRGQELADKLNQAGELYLEITKDILSPSTYFRKESTIRHSLVEFTNLVADRVHRASQEEFNHVLCEVIKDKLARGQVKEFVAEINRIIKATKLDHPLIEWNEGNGSKHRKKRKEIDYFTKDESDRIVEAFLSGERCLLEKSDPKYDPRLQRVLTTGYYIRFCFMTGCRLAEGAGLQVEDINLQGTISFNKTLMRVREGYILNPGLKTQDFRLFPVNAQLRELLELVIEYREGIGKKGKEEDFLFIFGGKGYESSLMRKDWRNCLEDLGIRYRKLYCMRHTFISNCLAKGIPVATVAKWVGNSPKTIYEHYSASTNEDVPEF